MRSNTGKERRGVSPCIYVWRRSTCRLAIWSVLLVLEFNLPLLYMFFFDDAGDVIDNKNFIFLFINVGMLLVIWLALNNQTEIGILRWRKLTLLLLFILGINHSLWNVAVSINVIDFFCFFSECVSWLLNGVFRLT